VVGTGCAHGEGSKRLLNIWWISHLYTKESNSMHIFKAKQKAMALYHDDFEMSHDNKLYGQ